MTGLDMAPALEQTPPGLSIATSRWFFPLLETLHVLAVAVVVGSVTMLDVRLLGLGNMQRPFSELMRNVLPWTWSAFVVAAICGGLLFSSKASTYYVNLPFRIKVTCLILAALNMLIFHWHAPSVPFADVGPPPVRARIVGAISLTLWIAIVSCGRWI